MTNQPAFPAWELNGQGKPEMTCFGITMPDYFAAKALQGFCASNVSAEIDKYAAVSYQLAEAMMVERTKRGL